jgi:hypothetical protein
MITLDLESFLTQIIYFLAQSSSIAKFVMPQTLIARLGQTLFVVQSIVALDVFLFASQREASPWASWVTSG